MNKDFVPFLIRAKRATYASGAEPDGSSRSASHDLHFEEGDYAYLDTYLGGFKFIGEEAVWKSGKPIWGMNYYGWMVSSTIPEGFSEFLKQALQRVTEASPYRGPEEYKDGNFSYGCGCEGDLTRFSGEEWIELNGKVIYELVFHGGEIRD
jgi:hypothetical protein